MKRVILSAAALLVGSIAFAQHDETAESSDKFKPAKPEPKTITKADQKDSHRKGFTVGGGFSLIEQVGIGSDAVVAQEGTENASFITQTGTSATDRNQALVLQTGNVDGDPGQLSGFQNYAELAQDGKGNVAAALQFGDENAAFSTQTGDFNTSLIEQGATSAQQGENNYGEITQDGTLNTAEIQQRFDNNMATSTQVSAADAAVGNDSYQEQVSARNQSNGHTAISTQNGSGNTVQQFQTGPDSAIGNYAEANQGDVEGEDTAVGAFAQQVQSGSGQVAVVNQKLSNDVSLQEQSGSDNTAVTNQNIGGIASGGDNYSQQLQGGSNNHAHTDQLGNNNFSAQEQWGDGNVAFTSQTFGQDGGNVALSIQDGFDNTSLIRQAASNNIASVDQLGSNHKSVINQNQSGTHIGDATLNGSNTAIVLQRDANGFGLTQGYQAVAVQPRTLSRLARNSN